MSKPEALRLAAELEPGWPDDISPDQMRQAAAELRRLHAENEAFKAESAEQCRIIGSSAETELRLRAENEALRKDAERYRAIRDDKADPYGVCIWENDEWAQDMRKPAFVDAAIDAAMKEQA